MRTAITLHGGIIKAEEQAGSAERDQIHLSVQPGFQKDAPLLESIDKIENGHWGMTDSLLVPAPRKMLQGTISILEQ